MAITTAMCNSFKVELLKGVHNFTNGTGHEFKAALYTSSTTLDKNTTAYGTPTNEITGTGYTAGGNALTNVTPSLATDTAITDFSDVSWTTASFTANGALIYNNTASGDPAVCTLAFGSDKTVSSGTFTIVFPTADASNAILRLA
jgi:hypothetical protein